MTTIKHHGRRAMVHQPYVRVHDTSGPACACRTLGLVCRRPGTAARVSSHRTPDDSHVTVHGGIRTCDTVTYDPEELHHCQPCHTALDSGVTP